MKRLKCIHANYLMLQALHTRRILFDIERSFYVLCGRSANWRNDKLRCNSRDCLRVGKNEGKERRLCSPVYSHIPRVSLLILRKATGQIF
jgi:hypothetical protein